MNTIYKIIAGKWRDINNPLEPLDPIEELSLISRFKKLMGLDNDCKSIPNLTHDKIHIAINLPNINDNQADIMSRCLELNDTQLKNLKDYIILKYFE